MRFNLSPVVLGEIFVLLGLFGCKLLQIPDFTGVSRALLKFGVDRFYIFVDGVFVFAVAAASCLL